MALTIAKFDWLTAERCLPGAWFGLRQPSSAPDEAELFRMEQGQEVGVLARGLYPDGILVTNQDGKPATQATQEAIRDSGIETVFEAAFHVAPFSARADILKRENGAWHCLEVKSSFSDSEKISDLVDDLGYTVWVLRQAGIQVTSASLVLLSRAFRFGDPPDRLFEIVTKTDEVNARVAEFEAACPAVLAALFDDTPPPAKLKSACRSCAIFGTDCLRAATEHTVFEIPALHHTKLKRLSDAGIIDLAAVPDDIKLNPRQERAKTSARTGNTIVEPGLAAALAAVQWPCHYLDFETVATVLPVYEGNGCHQQVLTQFSIHHRESIHADLRHSEYLADAARDCERELAEALIEKLGNSGSIIVYSSFEKTRITKLKEAFPDLAGPLHSILDRLMDLLTVIQDNVYHPEFKGSFSIKHVLPALVPDLSYAGLDVKNGEVAITRFARMARGEIAGDAVALTRQQLLDYCKMDTLAMVTLHEVLHQFAGGRRAAGG